VEKAVLIELLNQGLSTRSIARELGSSQTNVHYWLKKYGLKSPPRQHATNPAPAISRREVRRLEEEASGKRICSKCGVTKDLERFNFRSQRLGKRSPQCAECERAYARDYYARTLPAQRARARRRNRQARDEVFAKLLEHLEGKQCVDCGERDPVVLEFDHVTGVKRATIAELIGCWHPRWDDVLAEIEQCEIRCVNCHRRKTARERGYFKGLDVEATG